MSLAEDLISAANRTALSLKTDLLGVPEPAERVNALAVQLLAVRGQAGRPIRMAALELVRPLPRLHAAYEARDRRAADLAVQDLLTAAREVAEAWRSASLHPASMPHRSIAA